MEQPENPTQSKERMPKSFMSRLISKNNIMTYLKFETSDNFQKPCTVFELIEFVLIAEQTTHYHIVVYNTYFTKKEDVYEGDCSIELVNKFLKSGFVECSKTDYENAIINIKQK
jgi:hypothetical protein